MINLLMVGAEVIGALLTGSLALFADAAHLAADVGAIGLGLLASRLAALPGGQRQTFGYRRSEVLAALLNGLILAAIAVLIAVAAIARLSNPPKVAAGGMLGIGLFALLGNLAASAVLAGGDRRDINLEAVLRHSAADALGSLGVVIAAVVILAGGSAAIDPLISIGIAALVLASCWRLIKEPVGVLMEAAPADIDVEQLGQAFCAIDGVQEVHELHVWTLTAGFPALAAHVVTSEGADRDLLRRRLEVLLHERFGIDHTTLQMEEAASEGLLRVQTTVDPGMQDPPLR